MKVFLMVAVVVGAMAGQSDIDGGRPCDCQPIAVCASSLDSIETECKLQDGRLGVCCPPESDPARGQPRLGPSNDVPDGKMITGNDGTHFLEPLPNLTKKALATASQAGYAAVRNRTSLEQRIIQMKNFLRRGTPASGHLRQSRISPGAREMDKRAWAIVSATSKLMSDLNLTRSGVLGLRNVRVSETPLREQCPPAVTCVKAVNLKYRSADGTCNNLLHPEYGMSNTRVNRLGQNTYDDGVSSFRTRATDGSQLPSVRDISRTIMVDINRPDPTFTLSVMQFAQFMDHDLTHIPFPSLGSTSGYGSEGIDCCSNPNSHPGCQPIDLTGDPFFSQFGETCMNFVRSMLAVGPDEACTFSSAEQLNQLTHWIDGSNVYGSTDEEQRALRSWRNGLLLTSRGNMLPFNPDQGGDCEAEFQNAMCVLAGDSRVNEQPGLTVMHTLWMREHNRIAAEMQRLHPLWDDEMVFQEARRIVVAEIQHITFNEWLPIILGKKAMRSFELELPRRGFSNDYNATINPAVTNEFATAAFRFGHTLVQGRVNLFSSNGDVSTVQLRDNFNSPHLLQNEGRFDDLVRSLVQFPSQSFDNFVTEELTEHLFEMPGAGFGMDLMSLNIQRGRDHGIATYNTIREVCGLPRARDFDDFRDQIDSRLINLLRSLYRSVDDVDLFVGGLSETPLPRNKGLLGWTFTCIIGEQFRRLKKGDRLFYDLAGQEGSFTEDQLNEIRRTSLAKILCDNSAIKVVQPLAFELPIRGFNKPRPCSSIPGIDLRRFMY